MLGVDSVACHAPPSRALPLLAGQCSCERYTTRGSPYALVTEERISRTFETRPAHSVPPTEDLEMIHNRPHRRLPAVLGAITILAAGLGLMACAGGTTKADDPIAEVTSAEAAAPSTTDAPAETEPPVTAEAPVVTEAPAVTEAPGPETEGDGSVPMPDVMCMNLQDAQDLIQEAGVWLSLSEDATGEGRMQIMDSNWQVVGQTRAPVCQS